MIKDLASATLSPPVEFTAPSLLMRNCLEFPCPLCFGRETGLYFGGHGPVCNLRESGDFGSANYETPSPSTNEARQPRRPLPRRQEFFAAAAREAKPPHAFLFHDPSSSSTVSSCPTASCLTATPPP
jgi:hypothetical protein